MLYLTLCNKNVQKLARCENSFLCLMRIALFPRRLLKKCKLTKYEENFTLVGCAGVPFIQHA